MNKFRNENNNKAINWGKVLATTEAGVVYPSDIDGVLERNGQFLILEWKHHTVTKIPLGQDLMYRRLSQLPDFKVLYLFGCYDTWKISRMELLGGKRGVVDTDNQTLLTYMRNWWQWASKKGHPPQRQLQGA